MEDVSPGFKAAVFMWVPRSAVAPTVNYPIAKITMSENSKAEPSPS